MTKANQELILRNIKESFMQKEANNQELLQHYQQRKMKEIEKQKEIYQNRKTEILSVLVESYLNLGIQYNRKRKERSIHKAKGN